MAVVLWLLTSLASAQVLVAGRDVPGAVRIHSVTVEYPGHLRRAVPPPMGVVVLEVVVGEDGSPVDAKVLRGVPMLDEAAVQAVRQFRYRPTLVGGSPRRVALTEIVDVFPDERARIDFFVKTVKDKRQEEFHRVHAARRLKEHGDRKKAILKALQDAAKDGDEDIRAAANDALKALSSR